MPFEKGHKLNVGRKHLNLKRVCKRGHNTFICGRDSSGQCIDCRKIYDKEYYQRNIEKRKNQKQKWGKENRVSINRYRREHPEIYRLVDLQHEKSRKLRIVTFGQDGIKDFYANCPAKMEIDHIIPLQGKLVSGLHVIWNLQYLTLHDNKIKINKVNLLKVSMQYGKLLEKLGLK